MRGMKSACSIEPLEGRSLLATTAMQVVSLGEYYPEYGFGEPAVVKAGAYHYFLGPGDQPDEQSLWKSTGIGGERLPVRNSLHRDWLQYGDATTVRTNGASVVADGGLFLQFNSRGESVAIPLSSDGEVLIRGAGGHVFVTGDFISSDAYQTFLVSPSGRALTPIRGFGTDDGRTNFTLFTFGAHEYQGFTYISGREGVYRIKGIDTASPRAQYIGGRTDGPSMYTVGESLYIAESDGSDYRRWYRSDGTKAGTTQLSADLATMYSPPVMHNGQLWYLTFQGLSRGTGMASTTQRVVPLDRLAHDLHSLGNRLVFTVENQLWVSDGTPAGTRAIKTFDAMTDTYRGVYSYNRDLFYSSMFTQHDGRLYFIAKDSDHGWEVWETDGTDVGTRVHDVHSGPGDSNPIGLCVVDGRVYFQASPRAGHYSVYRIADPSNNTPPIARISRALAGTEGAALRLDASASTDADGDPLLYSWDLNGDGDHTDFVTNEPITSIGWDQLKSLGISDGPASFSARVRVSDGVATARSATRPLSLSNAPPKVEARGPNQAMRDVRYFVELVATDPSPDRVTQWTINWGDGKEQSVTGPQAQVNHVYAQLGSYTITATASDEDGTNSSQPRQVEVIDRRPEWTRLPAYGVSLYDGFGPEEFSSRLAVELNGLTLFSNLTSSRGVELWRTDHTDGGAALVKDLSRGSSSSYPSMLTRAGDLVYFWASNGIFRTDGTSEGTYAVTRMKNIEPASLRAVGDVVYFRHRKSRYGPGNLFAIHGDSVAPLVDASESGPLDPDVVVGIGNTAYFLANRIDGKSGRALWRSDGREAVIVENLTRGRRFEQLHVVEQRLVVEVAPTETLPGIAYISDGTAVGTRVITSGESDFERIVYEYGTSRFTGGRMFVVGRAYDSDEVPLENGLFSVGPDGVATIVRDADSELGSTGFEVLGAHDGVAFFLAHQLTGHPQLWRTDGTEAGTIELGRFALLGDFLPGLGIFERPITSAPHGFYFAGAQPGDIDAHVYRLTALDTAPQVVTSIGQRAVVEVLAHTQTALLIGHSARGLKSAWTTFNPLTRSSRAISPVREMPALSSQPSLIARPADDRAIYIYVDDPFEDAIHRVEVG